MSLDWEFLAVIGLVSAVFVILLPEEDNPVIRLREWLDRRRKR